MIIEQSYGLEIDQFIDAMIQSFHNVVPLQTQFGTVEVENESINVHFGTILGFTGDLKGQLIFHGDRNAFSKIGEVMFGMPISGEMLVSFTGELGNMLAGSLSTFIFEKGCTIDITPPSVLEGDSKISVFNQGVRFIGTVQEAGDICISILLRK